MAHIRGLDRWTRRVREIPQEVKEEVQAHVSTTAYKVEADAKRLAPVDTGNLRRKIKTKISDGGFVATVGTNVEYATYVEFGTSKMEAQPFLIPAYVKHKDDFENKLRDIANRIGD